MVSWLDICDSLANGLDNACTFVTEDDWESTLGILAGESVGVYSRISISSLSFQKSLEFPLKEWKLEVIFGVCLPVWQTPV